MKRLLMLMLLAATGNSAVRAAPKTLTPQQVIEAKADVLGEAALHHSGGPSYEFFERLLPPLRYVDADFRFYPIVLSAPGALVKAKLISNGSAINARARQPNWNNESGTPVHILVGSRRVPFGAELTRLDGPHYLDGYLPIVQLQYQQEEETYGEEVFASVEPALAERGAVLVKFDLPATNRGRIELRFEAGYDVMKVDAQHVLRDPSGAVLAQLDDNWDFNVARAAFISKVEHPKSIVAMIVTGPSAAGAHASSGGMAPEAEATGQQPHAPAPPAEGSRLGKPPGSGNSLTNSPVSQVDLQFYRRQRELSIRCWTDLLASGASIRVPEPIVMNAWRALLMAQHSMIRNDQLNYSALNQYARQYANESGDTMRSLLLWGHTTVARRGLRPLFVYRRPGIELHDGGFKLQDLADYYFVTRDAELIRELRPLWQREIDLILSSRQADGLEPREAYCSDIRTPVRSLNTNANCWRGLRDMAIVLEEIGEHEQAARLAAVCDEYKKVILAALEKATVREVNPPFVRLALDGEEPISNPITSTRYGSYWNLVVPCVLWSGLFPINSAPADAIIQYIQRNGGLCMGLTRVQSVRGAWVNTQNIDDLYVIRYSNALLKRDEPDRALVTFYGKLAQGFTRETFIDGESTGIEPLDDHGRQVALPPNSTANASFLMQLRNLLVQDWDMDDDGRADTLRLAFATPREWLRTGEKISVTKAPTAFGEVSFQIESALSRKQVTASIDLPLRPRKTTLIRLRLPDRWRIASTSIGELLKDGETIDISRFQGHVSLIAQVVKR